MEKTVVSIGEVVWDIFPDRQVLGGAPVNVAYHLSSLGLPVKVVTRVGSDDLGQQTLEHLRSLGVLVDCIQIDEELATGQVHVTVGKNNEPHFEIVAPAAWDNIDATVVADQLSGDEFVMVFGTLAQREDRSRMAIRSLWGRADFCFYDVNLRPPFTTKELVEDSLRASHMVKVNDNELFILADWFEIDFQEKIEIAAEIQKMFQVEILVVTEGAEGAWLLDGYEYYSDSGAPVSVADTVGAGDAFFATLIEGFLSKRPWPEILESANRRGGYVASQNGATPPMPQL